MFIVIYRWKIRAGHEQVFRNAWKIMTENIRRTFATGGSRLHQADNGEFVAYAAWPNRAQWQRAQSSPAVNPEAAATMKSCIEQSFPSTPLEVLDDLLSGADAV